MRSSPLDFDALSSSLLSECKPVVPRLFLEPFINGLRPFDLPQDDTPVETSDTCEDIALAAAAKVVGTSTWTLSEREDMALEPLITSETARNELLNPDGPAAAHNELSVPDKSATTLNESLDPGGKFVTYDEHVDEIWHPFVEVMKSKYGTDPADLVVPSGSVAARLLLLWHYPPLHTTNYRQFGFTADPSNSCMRSVAAKLSLESSLHGMVDGVFHMEHVVRRFDTTSARPYAHLPTDELAEYAKLKRALYDRSQAKVALLLGRVNFDWYKEEFPESILVAMSGPKVFGKQAAYCIEMNSSRTEVRRVVLFSVHPESWFYRMQSGMAAHFDMVWNTAATLSGRSAANLDYLVFRQNRLGELIKRHPINTDWDAYASEHRVWSILAAMRESEKIYKVFVPLDRIPAFVLAKPVNNEALDSYIDPKSFDSPVRQMLSVLSRLDRRTTREGRVAAYQKGLATRGLTQAGHMEFLQQKSREATEAMGLTPTEAGREHFKTMLKRTGRSKAEYIAPMLAAGKRKFDAARALKEEMGEKEYQRQRLRTKFPDMNDKDLLDKARKAANQSRADAKRAGRRRGNTTA